MAIRARWLLVPLSVLGCHASACGSFDDRELVRRGAAITAGAAGAQASGAGAASGGSAGFAPSDAGEAGSGEPGISGAGGSTGGTLGAAGASGAAGVAGTAAGSAGSVAVAGAPAGGSAGSSGSAGSGGSAGSNGASGAAGSVGNYPCGDINGNAIDDCTETSLVNSRFDADVGNWSAGFASVQTWDARDARGKASSGSISISNTLPTATGTGLAMTGSAQCVNAAEGAQYEVAVRVYVPSGQGGGQAGLNLWLFANDDCQGTLLQAVTPTAVVAVDQWSVVSSKLVMPAGSRSLLVRLVAAKPLPQPKLDALFDDVLLKKSP